MDEFSMVFYNNLLSIPCIMLLMYLFGKHLEILKIMSLMSHVIWSESRIIQKA
jgi:hypothetical protein